MNTNYYAKLAKNKSLLKEYKTSFCDRTVYLNDGDEFQFQLFNPEREEIVVRISIESSQLSHDIVLRPGERIWIERYTDTPKKFKFNTYYVNGKNKEVQDAIADNGDIRIQFFHKQKKVNTPVWINSGPNITWTYLNAPAYDWKDYTITCSNATTGSVKTNLNSSNSISTLSLSDENYSLKLDNNCITTADCSSALYSSPSSSFASTNVEENTKLETGRVMEGGHSNQKFSDVNMDFEYWPFRTETIKILPESRKPYSVNDLKKVYCTNCGRKLNTKYKYCPYCGEKID